MSIKSFLTRRKLKKELEKTTANNARAIKESNLIKRKLAIATNNKLKLTIAGKTKQAMLKKN
ncbi:MAG: hypothetical protein PHX27_03550 [Candidatus ainarchaeum sp.]|nr:hypothetical protein [Candidatus ainarchaeum sp.]